MRIIDFVLVSPACMRDLRKCDPFAALSAGIGATAQTVGDIINYVSNERANDANLLNTQLTNETNIKIARDNNAMQERLAREARDWQSNEALTNYLRQQDLMRLQADLNSPLAYIKSLRQAGMNPALAYKGSSEVASGGTPSTPTASGSGVTPSMPNLATAHVQPFHMASPMEAFAQFAQGMLSMSHARVSDQELEKLRASFSDEMAILHNNRAMSDNEALLNTLFAGQERDLGVQRLKVELAKDTAVISNLQKEGDLIAARAALTRMQEKSEDSLRQLRGVQARQVRQEADNYLRVLNAQFQNWASERARNYASAQESRENADFTYEQRYQLEQMRDYNIHLKENASYLSDLEYRKASETINSEIQYIKEHFSNLSDSEIFELQKLQQEINRENFYADKRNLDWVLGHLHAILNDISGLIPFAPTHESYTSYDMQIGPDGKTSTHARTQEVDKSRRMPWEKSNSSVPDTPQQGRTPLSKGRIVPHK